MSFMLNVTGSGPLWDDTITDIQEHAHAPYTTSFNNNDEIRFLIHQEDKFTLPSQSYLCLEYKVTDANDAAFNDAHCVSGFFANLFSEIFYKINGVVVDSIRNPGVASLMKNAMTFEQDESSKMENAGYKFSSTSGFANFATSNETMTMNVPLHYLLGFAEDYRKILLNVRQELVLKRNANDTNCLDAAGKVTIVNLTWMLPYVEVSDQEKLRLLRIVHQDTPIKLQFRHWELFEYPLLPTTKKHMWTVKVSDSYDTPYFIVIGLQTERRDVPAANGSFFDKCNMKDVRVIINKTSYPYESIDGDDCCIYNMYTAFNGNYNNALRSAPLFYKSALTDGKMMLFPIDCSRHLKPIKTGGVDIRVKFQTDGTNIPANTRAFCLMIHKVVKEYTPLTGNVVDG